MSATLTALTNAVPALPAKDQGFATSLASQWSTKGSLSPKQMVWVQKFIDRAAGKPEFSAQVGDIAPIVTMLETALANARAHAKDGKFKWPALLIATAQSGTLRISIAGPKSSQPGSITVTDTVKGFDGRRGWVGRITAEGKFLPGAKLAPPTVADVVAALITFAADPLTAAKEFGKQTNSCCFCAKTLTDGISVDLGYGPICAAKWGLGHDKKTVALMCAAVEGL